MGRKHKYADDPRDDVSLGALDGREYHLTLDGPRRYTPSDGASDGGAFSHLVESCSGSSSFWRPLFYRRDPGFTFTHGEIEALNEGWVLTESDERRAELEAQRPTYQPPRHPRACPSCNLMACIGPDYHALADIQDFQQRARAAHRQAGDYGRHAHDYSIL